jgi:thioredoxin 1
MLTPIMEQVKGKFSDISFEDIDIDSQFEVAQKYYVRSVPTVIIEQDGQEVQRFAGLQSELAYTNALNELKN